MHDANKWVIAFIAALLLQACTVTQYRTINKLSNEPLHKVSEPCSIKYSLSLSFTKPSYIGGVKAEEVGSGDAYEDALRYFKNIYKEATKEALSKKGCAATYVDNESDADIKIQVERTQESGGGGVGLIVGLTLGLMPVWETHEGKFTYTFYNTKAKTRHTSIVDETNYTHLFLMPIFWAFIEDEAKPYKESLIDFIDNCNAECQTQKSYKTEPPLGKATLVITRPVNDIFEGDLSINLNGLPIVELATDEFTFVYVDPGKLVIDSQDGKLKIERIIDISENEVVFVVWKFQKGGGRQWEIVPRSSAESYLLRYTYIPPKKNFLTLRSSGTAQKRAAP